MKSKNLFFLIGSQLQCLSNPHKAQYGGGIIINPELNEGLKGWSTFGNAKIKERVSGGNKFIVAHTRNHPHDSISQKLFLEKDKLYTFSGIYFIFFLFKTGEACGTHLLGVGRWASYI